MIVPLPIIPFSRALPFPKHVLKKDRIRPLKKDRPLKNGSERLIWLLPVCLVEGCLRGSLFIKAKNV